MKMQENMLHSADTARGYDVLRYDLSLDWMRPLSASGETGAERIYTGVQDITLRALQQRVNVIILDADAGQIRIDSIVRGTMRILHNHIGNLLLITSSQANPALNQGDTARFRIYFTHISLVNATDGVGFFLYRKGRIGAIRRSSAGMLDTVYVPERVAYTMSQPFGARRWMPCNDTPSDKALVSIRVRVPQGFTALANGTRREERTDSAGGTTFFYTLSSLVPPYLMAISASKYENFTEYYKKVSIPNDSIPVSHFFWKEDDTTLPLNNFNYNARATFQITIPTIAAYSRWFGEYPFESYGHVIVQPFSAGGMEHQTISTINRSWLRGQSAGIAHEIIHQWFGDKVTCASWEHIWLNEGMATYGEALWYESWGGLHWYNVAFEGFKRSYFSGNYKPSLFVERPNSIATIFNYATTYAKGAYVHHILRRMLGDSTYFRAMRLFYERYSVAETRDLQSVFEEVAPQSPIPLEQFFLQWVYGREHPVFAASWRNLPQQSSTQMTQERISINVSQVQRALGVPEVFHCVLPLVFVRGRDTVERVVVMNKRQQNFTLNLPFLPDTVLIDPKENLLAERLPATKLNTSATDARILVLGNPVNIASFLDILVSLPEKQSVTVEIIDVLGRQIQTVFQGESTEGAQTLRERVLFPAAGTYFVRLLHSNGIVTQKIAVMP